MLVIPVHVYYIIATCTVYRLQAYSFIVLAWIAGHCRWTTGDWRGCTSPSVKVFPMPKQLLRCPAHKVLAWSQAPSHIYHSWRFTLQHSLFYHLHTASIHQCPYFVFPSKACNRHSLHFILCSVAHIGIPLVHSIECVPSWRASVLCHQLLLWCILYNWGKWVSSGVIRKGADMTAFGCSVLLWIVISVGGLLRRMLENTVYFNSCTWRWGLNGWSNSCVAWKPLVLVTEKSTL